MSSLESALSEHGDILAEEYISGREATCGVIDGFRGKEIYTLPPVEIIHLSTNDICPGNFSISEKKEIERLSSLVHKTLGLRHYSNSDFILSPRRGIYFLEVNSLPGMTENSLIPKSLTAVGVSVREFLHHIISLALKR